MSFNSNSVSIRASLRLAMALCVAHFGTAMRVSNAPAPTSILATKLEIGQERGRCKLLTFIQLLPSNHPTSKDTHNPRSPIFGPPDNNFRVSASCRSDLLRKGPSLSSASSDFLDRPNLDQDLIDSGDGLATGVRVGRMHSIN